MSLAWRCKTSLCDHWQVLRHGQEHDCVTVKGDVVLSRNAVFIHSLLYISSFAVLVCLRYKAWVLHVVNTTGTHNLIIVDTAGSPSSIPVRQDWDRCEHAGITESPAHTHSAWPWLASSSCNNLDYVFRLIIWFSHRWIISSSCFFLLLLLLSRDQAWRSWRYGSSIQ